MPLISTWYIDIQADICGYIRVYVYIFYTGSHIFETKDERQSGWLQPCTIDYLLTINWLVLIFARASLFEPRVIATSFRAIIKKSSSQFGSNNHLQSPLSHGQKSDLSSEFTTALRGPIDFIYINIDRIISPILHIVQWTKSYRITARHTCFIFKIILIKTARNCLIHRSIPGTEIRAIWIGGENSSSFRGIMHRMANGKLTMERVHV